MLNCKYFLTHQFYHNYERILLSTHNICFGWEINVLVRTLNLIKACSKISNTFFLSQFSIKMFVIRAGSYKMLVRLAKTGKTLIRLLLQKQSDLGLHCLSIGLIFFASN